MNDAGNERGTLDEVRRAVSESNKRRASARRAERRRRLERRKKRRAESRRRPRRESDGASSKTDTSLLKPGVRVRLHGLPDEGVPGGFATVLGYDPEYDVVTVEVPPEDREPGDRDGIRELHPDNLDVIGKESRRRFRRESSNDEELMAEFDELVKVAKKRDPETFDDAIARMKEIRKILVDRGWFPDPEVEGLPEFYEESADSRCDESLRSLEPVENWGDWVVMEETLSDGSKAYSVVLAKSAGPDVVSEVELACRDLDGANLLAEALQEYAVDVVVNARG
jgi:hypothetical protein